MQTLEPRNTYTPPNASQVRCNCDLPLNRVETLSVAGLKTGINLSDIKKCALLFIIIQIALINVATAIQINNTANSTIFYPSATTGYITLGNGNYSALNITNNHLIINNSFKFNSSANITITNFSYINDMLNFTANASTGKLNITSKMYELSSNYTLWIDGTAQETKYSNSSGWVEFNISSWSQHNITILANPTITLWSNNITNDNSLIPRINVSTPIYFFATSDQVITTWNWYKDGVNQNNNQYDFTTSWNTLGTKTIVLTATNDKGTSPNKTWVVTVSDITNPWLINETVRASAISVGGSNNISANFTDDTNISSAIIRLQAPAPNATQSEYAMTCGASGNTSNCYFVTSDTPASGTYTVLYYSVTDGSAHTVNLTASNSFLVSAAPHIIEWTNTLTLNDTLSAIRANISVPIEFSIVTDAIVQYYTWVLDGIIQVGETAQSFLAIWNTLGSKNVSVTATNQFGTSLATTWSANITDITPPWLISSSTDSINSYVQGYPVTIYANFADDTNISSVQAHIVNPDLSEANWTMSCGISESTANCNFAYATTMNIGTYRISSFYPVDGTGNQRNVSSSLSFTTQPPLVGGGTGSGEAPIPSGGGGGAGGGAGAGATPTPISSISSAADLKINFTDIREGATEPMAIDIASCLTDSLTMNNQCSSLNYGVVVEPFNWWVAIGAYMSAIGIITIQSIRTDKKRDWLKETIIYGTFTVIISAVLVSVGFNVYIINYLIDSPKYAYTFLNFGVFGAFIAVVGDSYIYRNNKKTYKLKKKLSILEEF